MRYVVLRIVFIESVSEIGFWDKVILCWVFFEMLFIDIVFVEDLVYEFSNFFNFWFLDSKFFYRLIVCKVFIRILVKLDISIVFCDVSLGIYLSVGYGLILIWLIVY